MRVLVLSDIHGNIDALRALERQWDGGVAGFDRVVCLGDLVDYGPDPGAVVDWVRSRATDVVRGNHDHAMATGDPCGSAAAYLEASVATRNALRGSLTAEQMAFLGGLPLSASLAEPRWRLVHAAPSSPLYKYLPPESPDEVWVPSLGALAGQPVLVGHTHIAFVRPVNGGLVVNPGSIGMPKDGNPGGSYAVIHDGAVLFRRIVYDPEPMIGRLRALGLPEGVFNRLARTFRTGS
jgi:predicted phosphodiesterase